MSTAILCIGESGSGKTTALRNFKAEDFLLIQTIRKQLPFKNDYKEISKDGGNVIVTDNHEHIIAAMEKTSKKIIVIDDTQYMIANEFMRRSQERGYDKFTEMAQHIHSIIVHATQLADEDKRVYFLSHSETTDDGRTKFKTIGKLLDEKIVIEGLFTVVLKTVVEDGQFFFSTRNSGFDTVKTPMGMFADARIDNDLKLVDEAIKQYWNIK